MINNHKVGDTITAKFTPAFQDEVLVTGVIREFRGDMICCNQVGTNAPFFCYEHEIIVDESITYCLEQSK